MLHVFSTNRVKLWYTHNKSDNLLETQGVDCFKRGLKIITRYTCIINMKRTKFIHKCTYTDLIISRIFGKKKKLAATNHEQSSVFLAISELHLLPSETLVNCQHGRSAGWLRRNAAAQLVTCGYCS
jgi:hypothetical protein